MKKDKGIVKITMEITPGKEGASVENSVDIKGVARKDLILALAGVVDSIITDISPTPFHEMINKIEFAEYLKKSDE